ncbi:hypothetical protein T4B_2867 [Trichinella pseudospiralis]|uniref:Uncharacterized protein n=1 Tax=Trichinella pseudospiralis TaxID=6337 RepID=A0A0V1H3K6_TRIPS|nr:hypothetical protein T4B_2867 [Trichinella pseudospiralis]
MCPITHIPLATLCRLLFVYEKWNFCCPIGCHYESFYSSSPVVNFIGSLAVIMRHSIVTATHSIGQHNMQIESSSPIGQLSPCRALLVNFA